MILDSISNELILLRFFGCHKIRFQEEGTDKPADESYIVVMGNVFNTIKEIHVRYDLKGSTYGRTTSNT